MVNATLTDKQKNDEVSENVRHIFLIALGNTVNTWGFPLKYDVI